MPKFFNSKDLDFIKTISEEVVDYVVEQAVTLFKVSVGETKTNLYGESLGKVWRAPSTLMAIVDREPMNVVYEGFGAESKIIFERGVSSASSASSNNVFTRSYLS